ncbi:hypothetical protein K438DRAFT_1973704 [Mycena galopus ATCC 62051]|nr:hypothetical protein K438DRAFT_1973704 [Mycena galopus ATCC 62051]
MAWPRARSIVLSIDLGRLLVSILLSDAAGTINKPESGPKCATLNFIILISHSDYTGLYHSEVHHFQGYHRGEQGFYGFAFGLQQDGQFAPAQSYNLAQFIADFTDTGCDDWMPSSMGTIELMNLSTNNETGFYKLWFDGVKVLEKFNTATSIDDTREFQFHVRLYANGWHDDVGGMKGTQQFRQVWYDQIGMGTTFADADPDQ